jgi:hypothetical protein
MSTGDLRQVPIGNVRLDPANARATAVSGVAADLLVKIDGQQVDIVDGNLRVSTMADLGRLVPALDGAGQAVMLKLDASGEWSIATPQEIDCERAQSCMRVGRKVNAGTVAQAKKPVPYWRQFDKRKF